MQKENKPLQLSLRVISILVGLLFIFSGLIKANDPSGLAYKMGEFFEVWAREGYLPGLMLRLNDFSLLFSVVMIAFEIVAGVALIIGYRFRLFAFLILLLTIFFTFLTGYALFSGNIKECGCFGDCIRLQANESFMKDLILLALLLILVFFRSYLTDLFKPKTGMALMLLSLALSLGFMWYTLRYLPIKDCLAYRTGNNILNEMTPGEDYQPAEYRTMLVYEKDGVKKEFTDKNFPWQDTTWKFVDSKSEVVKEAQNAPSILDFAISDYNGQDITQTVLNYDGNLFLLYIKDVNTANTATVDQLKNLYEEAEKAGVPFLALSASNDIETAKFNTKHGLSLPFYTIDATVCKTAMRTNPGLMQLQKGTVKGKWSYANYPAFSSLGIPSPSNQAPLFPPPAPVVTDTTHSVQP